MILCLSSNQFSFVAPSQFEVGGDHGWVVPKSKNDQLYNQWASENRFKVDDTVCKYHNIYFSKNDLWNPEREALRKKE